MKKEKMKAFIWSEQKNKIVKTIIGTTNINGYFWNQYNKYCNEKGYTEKIEGNNYSGGMAWKNTEGNILSFIWEKDML